MDTTITPMTSTDRAFYPTLGPYLANRDVHRYLGGNLWDDPHKTWFVLRGGKAVVGFVSVNESGRRATVESLYLADDAPGNAAATLLAAVLDAYGTTHHLHAVVRKDHAGPYHDAGFAAVGETSNFLRLLRGATAAQKRKA